MNSSLFFLQTFVVGHRDVRVISLAAVVVVSPAAVVVVSPAAVVVVASANRKYSNHAFGAESD